MNSSLASFEELDDDLELDDEDDDDVDESLESVEEDLDRFFILRTCLRICLSFLLSCGCALKGRPDGGGGIVTSTSSGGMYTGWSGNVIALLQLRRMVWPFTDRPSKPSSPFSASVGIEIRI